MYSGFFQCFGITWAVLLNIQLLSFTANSTSARDFDTKFKCSKGRDDSNVNQFYENILQGQFLVVLACECQLMLAFSVKQTHSKSIHVLWNDSKHTDSCQTNKSMFHDRALTCQVSIIQSVNRSISHKPTIVRPAFQYFCRCNKKQKMNMTIIQTSYFYILQPLYISWTVQLGLNKADDALNFEIYMPHYNGRWL